MCTARLSVARAALALAAAAGCGTGGGGTPDEELGGLVHAPVEAAPAIDVTRAAKDPAMLAAAMAIPEHRATAALGPHTLTAKSHVVVMDASAGAGAAVEDLGDDVTLDDAGATFHATENNTADYGREIVFTGGTLYLRPRYARWHARPPEDGEPDRLRDEVGATWAAHVELFAGAITAVDRGDLEVAGRPARRIALEKSAMPRSAPQTLTQRKWREGAQVQDVSGEVVLDARTGVPLHGHLEGTLQFTRDGHAYTMKVTVDHDVSAIGAAPAIAAPPADETVATPERLREVDERDLLLKGMAPPARRQPQAGATGSGATGAGATGAGAASDPGGAATKPGATP